MREGLSNGQIRSMTDDKYERDLCEPAIPSSTVAGVRNEGGGLSDGQILSFKHLLFFYF